MKTKLLLIAEKGLSRTAYSEVLHDIDIDIEVDCISSPDEITGTLIDAPYSGLLIDVPTMIRCECGDKNRITRIMDRFPVLRLMYNQKHGGIRGLTQGGTVCDNRDLTEFVLKECVPFSPRSIRVAQRQGVVFNVMLFGDLDRLEQGGEHSVTVNISEHGCFIYSAGDWRVDNPAWIVVRELEDQTPIKLMVRWHRPWGGAMHIPGIGAGFESMTSRQFVQLHSFL